MKKVLAAVLLASASLGASASVITDVIDPPNVAVTTTTSRTYTHNILDQGFVPGFDTLLSALLTITLTDPNNGQEKVYFVLNSGLQQVFTKNGNNNVNNGGTADFEIALNNHSLEDLADGMMAFTVSATAGEYFFAKSELAVTYTPGVVVTPPPPVNQVPEPWSVTLMGFGLLALRYGRRR